MYQETVRYPAMSRAQEVRYYGLLALAVLLICVCSGLLSRLGVPHTDLPAAAALALLAALLLYQRVFSYRYELTEDALVLTRLYGDHEKRLLSVPLDALLDVGEVRDDGLPAVRACVWTKKLRKTQAVYEEKGKKRKAVFQPSDVLVEKLRALLSEKETTLG